MTSYDGLLRKLEEKGLTKTDLTEKLGISSRTVAKISRGEKIADHVLKKIADFLDCTTEELCRSVSDNALLQTLRRFWTVNRRNYAEISLTTHCCKRCVMKRASVCRAGCITNCRCG